MFGSPEGPDGLMPDIAEGASAPRPGEMTAAVVLLVTAGVLWLPIAGGDPAISQAAGPLLFLLILFAVRAGRGRQKARITVGVVTPLLLFLTLPHAWLGFTDPDYLYGAEYAVMDIVAIIAACTGLGLLFSPSSNAYVRERMAALNG